MKIRPRLFVAGVVMAFFSGHAVADWPLDFVRIACIPEARFLKIEYSPVNGGSALADAQYDDAERRRRLDVWRKHGFFDPSKLKFECKLPESVYRVTATQPDPSERGMCGGAPRITLNLTKNGKKLLDQVIFGNDCFERTTVSSLTVTDNLAGWGTGYEVLCIYPKGGMPGSYSASRSTTEICDFLSDDAPIDQSKLINFAKGNEQ